MIIVTYFFINSQYPKHKYFSSQMAILCLFLGVTLLVHCPHENTTTDNISNRDGNQVVNKEVSPRKNGRIYPFSHCRRRIDRVSCGKNPRRNVVHIGNTMLEAAYNKQKDGKVYRCKLFRYGAAAGGESKRQRKPGSYRICRESKRLKELKTL